MAEVDIRQGAEPSLPMRSLEESTRIIQESYQKEGELAQAYLDEVIISGRELAAVKVHDTYGEGKYANFDEYCKNELPYMAPSARSRILFYEITKAARAHGVGEPTSLRQVEALKRAVRGSTEDRTAHWLSIAGGEVEVTTKSIQNSVDDPVDDKKTLTYTTDDGETLEAESPQELAKKMAHLFAHVPQLPAPPEEPKITFKRKQLTLEEAAKKLKELDEEKKTLTQSKKGAERAEKNLQAQIDRRIEDARQAFLQEMANVKARYGDFEPPEFADIDEDAWIEMAKEAQDVRVKEAGGIIRKLYTGFPEMMGQYMPSEAALATLKMGDSGAILMALEFVRRWIDGVIEEMENEESLAAQRARR